MQGLRPSETRRADVKILPLSPWTAWPVYLAGLDAGDSYKRGWDRCIEQLNETKQELAVAAANQRNKTIDTIKDGLLLGLSVYASRRCGAPSQ